MSSLEDPEPPELDVELSPQAVNNKAMQNPKMYFLITYDLLKEFIAVEFYGKKIFISLQINNLTRIYHKTPKKINVTPENTI